MDEAKAEFQKIVEAKGRELYRDMPWRRDTNGYYVLVSELMLQQTQVDRVIPKFDEFIRRFPDIVSLARAPLAEVIRLWQGLGYNRRAKYLHDAANLVTSDYSGRLPDTSEELVRLPGIGINTAGAIRAYVYNQPTVFIETNVRSVYFYHFFPHGEKVHDNELRQLVSDTIDRENPRQFYWALMDYGSWLKKQGVGAVAQSAGYIRQSKLKGSVREVRGVILRQLITGETTLQELRTAVQADERFEAALSGLVRDGLVVRDNSTFYLTHSDA